MVCPRFYPDLGGVERHVLEVSRDLVARGHQVIVVSARTDGAQLLRDHFEGIEVIRLVDPLSKIKVWRQIWQHRAVLDWADVIQVHDVMWWFFPWWWYRSWLKKMHITFHGWEGNYPVFWRHKILRWISGKYAKSRLDVGAWIQEFYWGKPDAVTYGGATTLKNTKTTNPDFSKKHPQIAFLGRLESENAIEQFLALVKRLKKNWPSLEMTWIGDGSWRQHCQEQGSVTGWVSHPVQLASRTDLVFANSYLSISESFAAGKPVVSVFHNRLKKRYLETFPGENLLLYSSDISLLEKKITALLSNKNSYEKLCKKTRDWAEGQSWQKVVDTYYRLWGWL